MVNQSFDLNENNVVEQEIVSKNASEVLTDSDFVETEVAEAVHTIENKTNLAEAEIAHENNHQTDGMTIDNDLMEIEALATADIVEETPLTAKTVASNGKSELIEELPTLEEKILLPEEQIVSETTSHDEIHEIQSSLEEVVETPHEEADYSTFEKKDFVDLVEKLLTSIKKEGSLIADIRNADNVLKEIKPVFDELKAAEKKDARQKFVAENGNDEGFQYKNDNFTVRFESLAVQIRDEKNKFFKKIENERESNFERKTQLLQQLRLVVEGEENGEAKDTWKKFKQIQDDWKAAGNVNSPHNTSLWSAYSALIDRYFSIRNIQNELKDLDRKKNLTLKTEIIGKIEAIAQSLETTNLTNTALKQANELLEEYKHIGPTQRDTQEELRVRMKTAFDAIYGKRREQTQSMSVLQDEIFAAKARLFENIQPYLTFESTSINEWNAKTKEVMAIQDQWNGIKGAMQKDKGKDLSTSFWAALKTFFQRKGEFFKKLEASREENLKLKNNLCEQVETLLAEQDTSAEATDKVIELQKTWRTIGHVPEKYKDKIFDRFKKACDEFFNAKRNKNNDIEQEYEENLKKKVALCLQIETAAKSKPDLSQLPELKAEFNAIGYVPRKEMQNIQRRFIDAINSYVKASSGASGAEKEKILLQNEVEVVLKGQKGGTKNLDRKENDIRHKIKNLEDDMAVWKNNIEFFARSKNADTLKADFDKKIQSAENELVSLKQQLKIIVAAN